MALITPKILWTALPAGRTSGGFRVSIFVSPRLEGVGSTGMLQDYDMGNWTSRIKALVGAAGGFKVQLGSALGPVVPLSIPAAYSGDLNTGLWDDIFPPPTTKVTERKFQDHTKRWIRSFSIRPLESYIQGLYNQVADASPTGFPDIKGANPVTRFVDAFQPALGYIREGLPQPRQPKEPRPPYKPLPQGRAARATHPESGLEQALTGLAASMGVSDIPLAEFYRAYRFYRRGNQPAYRSKDEPWDPSLIPDRPKPTIDFHQAIAALGDHPQLLRRLGLIVEGVIEDTVLAGMGLNLAAFDRVQVVVGAPHPPVTDLTPWTLYDVGPPAGFRARPRSTGDIANGLLRVDDTKKFDVFQADPDGNVLKVFDYAANMVGVRARLLAEKSKNPQAKSSQAPAETSLPAQRNGGFTVARLGRDDAMWDHFVNARAHETAPDDAVLYADDVARGFRVDVHVDGAWYSVCRRTGTYDVKGTVIPEPGPDEGYVKAASASSDADGPSTPMQQPDMYLHESVFAWTNWSLVATPPGKTISVDHYDEANKRQRVKVEPVENKPAAGFNVGTSFKAEKLSLPPLRFGKKYKFRARVVDVAGNSFSPPPSPLDAGPPVDPAPPGLGESPEAPYLRFDPMPAPTVVPITGYTPGESAETMVARSRSLLGVMMGGSPAPFDMKYGLNEGAIFNPSNDRWIAAPKCSIATAELHGALDPYWKKPSDAYDIVKREAGSFNDAVAGAKIIDQDGNTVPFPIDYNPTNPLPAKTYIVHTESPLALPYLPEPLAIGAAFMPQDGTGSVLWQPYDTTGGWPNAAPFLLTLGESPGSAPVFGLGTLGTASAQIPRGTMLTVRYATVMQPPGSSGPGPLEAFARWWGMSPLLGRAKVKANGWQHWMLTPWRTLTLVHAVEKPMAEPVLTQLARSRNKADTFVELFGACQNDSHSTGEFEIQGNWTEYLDLLHESGPRTEPRGGHVVDLKVDYEESLALFPKQKDRGEPPRHEFGDTKHRNVDYRAVGTTRYREYFPPELTKWKELITAAGPPHPINVPSSERPDPPKVLYIVPTFKWVDVGSSRTRKGRGLRIYLDRPWYSSGEGELLGFVLKPASGPFDETKALQYISQWGADPLFDRTVPATPLAPSNFTYEASEPEAVAPVTSGPVNLAELASQDVRVVGYKPNFDTQRRLWYVDVELLPTSSYYTFVRFALCRYQPDSVFGCHISKVVRAEFAQLLADRTATLTYGTGSIGITVFGQSALNKVGVDVNSALTPIGTISVMPPRAVAAPSAAANALPTAGGSSGGSSSLEAVGPIVGPPVEPPIIVDPILVPNPQAGAGHRVTATIEWRPEGAAGDLGWQPLDAGTVLVAHTSISSMNPVSWKGSLAWPRRGLPPNREYRIVLREMDLLYTDDETAESIPNLTGSVRGRLAYLDVFPLAAP